MFRRSTSIHFIIAVVGIILGGMIAHPSAQGFSLFYWAEQDRFSPGEPGHHFGESVAIDGDIMVVGATSSSQYAVPAAYVYTGSVTPGQTPRL